jgi:titin
VNSIGNAVTATSVIGVPFALATAPQTVAASGRDRSIYVSWTAPANLGGYALFAYRVERSVDGIAWTVAGDTKALNYTVGGLANGSSWYVRVTAITGSGPLDLTGGLGVASLPVLATAMSPASAPRSMTGEGSDGTATLRWLAPSDNGGTALSGYRVEVCTSACSLSGGTWTVLTVSTNSIATTYVASGLTNGTNYFFRISALTQAGQGAATLVSVMPGAPASAPGSLRAINGNAQVALDWNAPATTGGFTITAYQVAEYRDNGHCIHRRERCQRFGLHLPSSRCHRLWRGP